MKKCPYCGKEYPEDAQVCSFDQETLVPVEGVTPSQAEQQEFGARLRAATPHVFITPAIVAINVLVFVLMALVGAGVMGDLNPEVHVKWGANFGPLTTDGEWWRLLTSTFLHFGILHLAFNMWALYATGQMVERLYGNAFFLVLYLAGGVTGSVASVLWNPKVLSAGASGAIFGVYGALLAYLLLQRQSVPASIVGPLRNSAMAFTAYNLFFGATQAGIDNAAHLGGLLGGGLAGLSLARPLDVDVRRTIALSRIFAGLAVAALIPIILWLPVRNSGKPYQQERRFQADVAWFVNEEKSIVSDWEEVRKKIQAGSIGEVEAARMLEPSTARWEQVYERLSQAKLEEQAPSSERRASLLNYVALRRDAMKALIPALRTGDITKLAEFKDLQSKAGKALEEINRGQRGR